MKLASLSMMLSGLEMGSGVMTKEKQRKMEDTEEWYVIKLFLRIRQGPLSLKVHI
jgi:hypothetical protein